MFNLKTANGHESTRINNLKSAVYGQSFTHPQEEAGIHDILNPKTDI